MKVKFGVNTLVWCLPFAEKHLDLIDKVGAMGFEVIELTPAEEYENLPPEKVRRRLEKAKVEVSVCAAFGQANDISVRDASIRQKGIDFVKGNVDWIRALGGRIIGGPIYAEVGRKRFINEAERKAEWDRAVESLKRIGEYAEKKGAVIAIEPINRFETDMVNLAQQAYRMCEQVGNPAVRMMLDTFHMNIEERRIGDAIKASKKHLVHLHTCSNDRGAPGDGHIPWHEVRQALIDIDYDGYGVIESFAQGQVAAFANIWRPLVDNQEEIPRRGLQFLREALRS